MKKIDAIISFVAGLSFALLLKEILDGSALTDSIYLKILLFLLPFLAIFGFWLTANFFSKQTFIKQFAQYCLIGAITTFFDLKIFDLAIMAIGTTTGLLANISKGVSFFISVLIKFIGNKFWTFEKNGKEGAGKELTAFLIVTALGIIIDVAIYNFFDRFIGPQFGIGQIAWSKASVILAGIVAAIWNFLGYKFIIFKK